MAPGDFCEGAISEGNLRAAHALTWTPALMGANQASLDEGFLRGNPGNRPQLCAPTNLCCSPDPIGSQRNSPHCSTRQTCSPLSPSHPDAHAMPSFSLFQCPTSPPFSRKPPSPPAFPVLLVSRYRFSAEGQCPHAHSETAIPM